VQLSLDDGGELLLKDVDLAALGVDDFLIN